MLLQHAGHAACTARTEEDCAQGQVPAQTFSAVCRAPSFSSWPACCSLSVALAMQWVPGKAAGRQHIVDGRQGLRRATMRCPLLTCILVAFSAAAAVLLSADAAILRSDSCICCIKASGWAHCQHAAASRLYLSVLHCKHIDLLSRCAARYSTLTAACRALCWE